MIILHIETSGLNCSVALSKDNHILAEKSENAGKFTHSENLHLFIEDVMQQASLPLSAVDAIAVSAGAGSYTGLRIGIATAKGLCFALEKPHQTQGNCIIPMLDARRMEVYSAVFNSAYQFVSPTEAKILDEHSYQEELNRGKVTFLGDGSTKFATICKHPNAVFIPNAFPEAKDMLPFAIEKYTKQDFEDIAYFEPQYLK